MSFTSDLLQGARTVAVSTGLGEDILVFESMTLTEHMSQPFDMRLNMICAQSNVSPDEILGHNITVRYERGQNSTPRYFNGYVTSFVYGGVQGRNFVYSAVVRPWLWFLTKSSNSRIFHNMTAKAIIEQIFGDHGVSDYQFQASPTVTYEYTVQYQETDFEFVSRLMEREGYYYYFSHENGLHKMHIVDQMSHHQAEPSYDTMNFVPRDSAGAHQREGITAFREISNYETTTLTVQDYSFKEPRADFSKSSSISRGHGATGLEHYEYPGQYAVAADGDAYASKWVEAIQTRQLVYHGESNVRGVKTGRKFTLAGFDPADKNQEYLITGATYNLTVASYESGAGGLETRFANTFNMIPSSRIYRAPRVTPKPKIVGPQTAVVVNENGADLDLDEWGRVCLSFNWEREGTASMRCRVSSIWAGNEWGFVANPRNGQEVIVEFLDGDPDRPIITGRVYNDAAKPPYDPQQKATVTTLKDRSSPDGGGFNELQFESKGGEEHVFLHSQKDTHLRTHEKHIEWIGTDEHQRVDENAYRLVGAEQHVEVSSDNFLTVGGANHVKVTSDHLVKSDANMILQSGQEMHIKGGTQGVVEASTGLTLKVGGNHVTIDMSGVTIVGTMVKINSGGSALSGAGTAPEAAEEPEEPREEEPKSEAPPTRDRSFTFSRAELDTHPVAAALLAASDSGAPFCEQCERARREREGA